MKLRTNQVKPVEVGVSFMKSNKSKPSIIVAPTAFGKSIVIAEIVRRLDEKVIILQPSKELLEQNYNKFINLGGEAEIFSASMGSKDIGRITYATIGSIKKVPHIIKDQKITKIIIDECDRFPREKSGMLRTFVDSIKATHVLGLTATPLKLQTSMDLSRTTISKWVMLTSPSKKGNFFKNILHVAQIQEMLDLGFWTPLIYEDESSDTSVLKFNTSKSEYTQESIWEYYKNNSLDNRIVKKISELKDRKAILVAVPKIEDAEGISAKLPNSAVVHSYMKKSERDDVVKRFKSGDIKIIVQVNVLTVGFDYPELDCLICARASSSISWWYQFLGRGTRIHPDKKDTLVIDYVGSTKRLGKIEDLVYKKDEKDKYQLYGEGGKLMSGIPIDSIGVESLDYFMPFGKYKGSNIKHIPKSYKEWMLKEFKWNESNKELRDALMSNM